MTKGEAQIKLAKAESALDVANYNYTYAVNMLTFYFNQGPILLTAVASATAAVKKAKKDLKKAH